MLKGTVLFILSAGVLLLHYRRKIQEDRCAGRYKTAAVREFRRPTSWCSRQIPPYAARRPAKTAASFAWTILLPGAYRVTVSAHGLRAGTGGSFHRSSASVREVTVTLKPAARRETVNVQGQSSSSITTQPIDLASAVHRRRSRQPGLEESSSARPQLRQHRVSCARNRAGRAFRSHQGAHHGRLHRRKLGIEQRTLGRWRRQLRRLDWRLPAKFFARWRFRNLPCAPRMKMPTQVEPPLAPSSSPPNAAPTTGTADGAFYERAAALNARFPIENPAQTCTDGVCVNNPKQPFSRQNYVGTIWRSIAQE